MIDVSGFCTIAATDTSAQPLVAREHHFGLVGDRGVDLAGGEQLSGVAGSVGTWTWTFRPAWANAPSLIAS